MTGSYLSFKQSLIKALITAGFAAIVLSTLIAHVTNAERFQSKGTVTPNACSSPGTSSDRPNNRPPLHPNGTLVKISGDPRVYLIDGGRKRGIPSQSVLNNLYTNGGFTNNDVITIGADELALYSPGTDVSGTITGNGRNQPDGRLISSSGGEVSIVTNNGGRRPFSTSTRFQNLGYQFCNVVSVTDYGSYQPVGMAVGDLPSLSSPADVSSGQSTTPTLSWGAVSLANNYRVQAATSLNALPTSPYFTECFSCIINTTTTSTSYTPSSGVLSPGTQYFWQIQALNFPDQSVWSATWSFTTTAPSDGMQLISQTPIDESLFTSNQLFNATWRLQNTGGTTWNSNYSAVWIQTPVGGNESTNLTSPLRVGASIPNASPGATVDLTVSMIGPSSPGTYYMYWQLQNANGVSFGSVFHIKIVVSQATDESFGNDKEGFGSGDSPGSNAGINDDSLNTATGNFNYQVNDMVVPGRGLDFIFSRSYNAKDTTTGPLGAGWSHSFNLYLNSPNSEVTNIHYGDGKVLAFNNGGAGSLYKPLSKGFYDSLTRNGDNTWTLLKPDQKEYHFDSFGRLAYIQDLNANRITLSYNADGTLASVVDTVGRQFIFSYSGGLLIDIADPINRHLQFQYTSGRLSQFRDAKNNTDNYSYDGNGRLFEVFDARTIRRLSNSYDSQGRLVSQTNGRGFQWLFSYDDVSRVTRVTDPNQKQIVYNHDSGNKLVSFTNRQNGQTAITYESNNLRQTVTDLNGRQFFYSYIGNGNVDSSKDPLNNTREFTYDTRNNPTSAKDELKNSTFMNYDSRGNLVTLTDALSRASSITYNSFGQPTAITDPNQHTTNLTYDAQGNLRTIQDPMSFTTIFDYDAVGRRIRVTNGRGKVTSYGYDNNDNLISVQRPIGTTSYGYDQVDNLTSITDPNQNITRYEYDANNNRTKETDPVTNFVQHTYDNLDRLIATRDKRGNTTNFAYDFEGRLTSITDALTNITVFTYDGNGNRLTSTDANNQTTRFTYDALNRLTKVEDPLHNISSKDYDPAGRLIRETDARSNVAQFTYDEVNNLIKVVDSENGVTEYTYDNNHNLKTQKDPNLNLSNLTYDNDDRLVSSADPLGNSYGYVYDAVGNRVSQTDAKHQTIQFTYDDNDRLTRIFYPDSTSVQMTYDADGNLTQIGDAIDTTTYSYDQLNRISSYTDVYGKTISYGYDQNGNVMVLTYPDGKQVNYVYDANNRMISFTDWGGKTVGYQYNSINLLTRITPPASSDNGATTYTYDLAGRLTAMVNLHTRGGGNSYNFTLDANGNRILSNVQEPLNNRVAATSQSYGYDSANRIQFAGGAGFSFDANGNMTSKTDGATTNYTYDFNDRLINDQTNSYFYSGQGVRVAKSQGGVQTRYVVDVNRELSQVLCETDSGGNITSYYVYGQGLVYKVLPNGTHYYYQFDPNGSTVSMTTEGDFYVNRYAYDPYGKITNRAEVFPNTNTTVSNPFKFGGRFGLMDEGNGLVYVRARYYLPDLGRFLTKDPLTGDTRDGQSLNRYIYALDNPIGAIDVNGLYSVNNFWSDAKEMLTGTALGLGRDAVKWGYKGAKITYTQLGYHEFDYIKGGIKGGLKSGISRNTVASNISDAGVGLLANKIVDWGLNKIEGPRQNVKVNIPGYGEYDLSQGLPIASKVPLISAVNLAAGKILFRYGVAGDNADENGDLWENGKKVGNLRDYGITGPAQVNVTPKAAVTVKRGAVTPRGPAVKVMPRGPAAAPIMPRGPKPAPISPRGTKK